MVWLLYFNPNNNSDLIFSNVFSPGQSSTLGSDSFHYEMNFWGEAGGRRQWILWSPSSHSTSNINCFGIVISSIDLLAM